MQQIANSRASCSEEKTAAAHMAKDSALKFLPWNCTGHRGQLPRTSGRLGIRRGSVLHQENLQLPNKPAHRDVDARLFHTLRAYL